MTRRPRRRERERALRRDRDPRPRASRATGDRARVRDVMGALGKRTLAAAQALPSRPSPSDLESLPPQIADAIRLDAGNAVRTPEIDRLIGKLTRTVAAAAALVPAEHLAPGDARIEKTPRPPAEHDRSRTEVAVVAHRPQTSEDSQRSEEAHELAPAAIEEAVRRMILAAKRGGARAAAVAVGDTVRELMSSVERAVVADLTQAERTGPRHGEASRLGADAGAGEDPGTGEPGSGRPGDEHDDATSLDESLDVAQDVGSRAGDAHAEHDEDDEVPEVDGRPAHEPRVHIPTLVTGQVQPDIDLSMLGTSEAGPAVPVAATKLGAAGPAPNLGADRAGAHSLEILGNFGAQRPATNLGTEGARGPATNLGTDGLGPDGLRGSATDLGTEGMHGLATNLGTAGARGLAANLDTGGAGGPVTNLGADRAAANLGADRAATNLGTDRAATNLGADRADRAGTNLGADRAGGEGAAATNLGTEGGAGGRAWVSGVRDREGAASGASALVMATGMGPIRFDGGRDGNGGGVLEAQLAQTTGAGSAALSLDRTSTRLAADGAFGSLQWGPEGLSGFVPGIGALQGAGPLAGGRARSGRVAADDAAGGGVRAAGDSGTGGELRARTMEIRATGDEQRPDQRIDGGGATDVRSDDKGSGKDKPVDDKGADKDKAVDEKAADEKDKKDKADDKDKGEGKDKKHEDKDKKDEDKDKDKKDKAGDEKDKDKKDKGEDDDKGKKAAKKGDAGDDGKDSDKKQIAAKKKTVDEDLPKPAADRDPANRTQRSMAPVGGAAVAPVAKARPAATLATATPAPREAAPAARPGPRAGAGPAPTPPTPRTGPRVVTAPPVPSQPISQPLPGGDIVQPSFQISGQGRTPATPQVPAELSRPAAAAGRPAGSPQAPAAPAAAQPGARPAPVPGARPPAGAAQPRGPQPPAPRTAPTPGATTTAAVPPAPPAAQAAPRTRAEAPAAAPPAAPAAQARPVANAGGARPAAQGGAPTAAVQTPAAAPHRSTAQPIPPAQPAPAGVTAAPRAPSTPAPAPAVPPVRQPPSGDRAPSPSGMVPSTVSLDGDRNAARSGLAAESATQSEVPQQAAAATRSQVTPLGPVLDSRVPTVEAPARQSAVSQSTQRATSTHQQGTQRAGQVNAQGQQQITGQAQGAAQERGRIAGAPPPGVIAATAPARMAHVSQGARAELAAITAPLPPGPGPQAGATAGAAAAATARIATSAQARPDAPPRAIAARPLTPVDTAAGADAQATMTGQFAQARTLLTTPPQAPQLNLPTSAPAPDPSGPQGGVQKPGAPGLPSRAAAIADIEAGVASQMQAQAPGQIAQGHAALSTEASGHLVQAEQAQTQALTQAATDAEIGTQAAQQTLGTTTTAAQTTAQTEATQCRAQGQVQAQVAQQAMSTSVAAVQATAQTETVGARAQRDAGVAQSRVGFEAAQAQATAQYTTQHAAAQQTFNAQNQAAQTQLAGQQQQAQAQAQGQQAQARAQNQADVARESAANEQRRAQAQSTHQQEVAQADAQAQADQQRIQGDMDQQVAQTNATMRSDVSSEERRGQQTVDRHLQEGERSYQSEIRSGEQQAEAERQRAEAEAERKRQEAEAQKDEGGGGIFGGIVSWVKDRVNDLLDLAKSIIEAARAAVMRIMEAARAAAMAVLNAAREAAMAALNAAKQAIQGLISAAASAVRGLISAAASMIRGVINALSTALQGLVRALTTALTALVEAFQTFVNFALDTLIAAVSLINEDLGRALDQATQGFRQAFNSACDTLQTGIQAAGQALEQGIQAAADRANAVVTAVETQLNAAVTAIEQRAHQAVDQAFAVAEAAVNAAFDAAEAGVNAAFDAAEAVANAAFDVAQAAVEGYRTAFNAACDAAIELADRALTALGDLAAAFVDLLPDSLIEGFIDFWNGPWRSIIIVGLATIAAVAITVATGGLGGPIAGMLLAGVIGGTLTGAAYFGGELVARAGAVDLAENGNGIYVPNYGYVPIGANGQPDLSGVPQDQLEAVAGQLGPGGWAGSNFETNPDGTYQMGPDGTPVGRPSSELANSAVIEGIQGFGEGFISAALAAGGGSIGSQLGSMVARRFASQTAQRVVTAVVSGAVEGAFDIASSGATTFWNTGFDALQAGQSPGDAFRAAASESLNAVRDPGAIAASLANIGVSGTRARGLDDVLDSRITNGLVRQGTDLVIDTTVETVAEAAGNFGYTLATTGSLEEARAAGAQSFDPTAIFVSAGMGVVGNAANSRAERYANRGNGGGDGGSGGDGPAPDRDGGTSDDGGGGGTRTSGDGGTTSTSDDGGGSGGGGTTRTPGGGTTTRTSGGGTTTRTSDDGGGGGTTRTSGGGTTTRTTGDGGGGTTRTSTGGTTTRTTGGGGTTTTGGTTRTTGDGGTTTTGGTTRSTGDGGTTTTTGTRRTTDDTTTGDTTTGDVDTTPTTDTGSQTPGPRRRDDDDVDVDDGGTAADLGGFRGDSRPFDQPDLTDDGVQRQIADRDDFMPPDVERLGDGFVLPDGTPVTLRVGDSRDGSVASYDRTGDGYEITVSRRASDDDIARAVAHELAELRVREQGVPDGPDALGGDRLPDGASLSAHDHGRLAELRLLAGDLGSGGDLRTRHEIQSLLDSLGLRSGQPDADARLDLLRPHLDPDTLAIAERMRDPQPLQLQASDVDTMERILDADPRFTADADALAEVMKRARQGDAGALGELEAVQRWLAEGRSVQMLPEVQNGPRNPDFRVDGQLTDVKTSTTDIGNRGISRDIEDVNDQIKRSAFDERGAADLQLHGDAARAPLADIEQQVRRQFNPNRSRSLERVSIHRDGVLIGEWVRNPDGTVSRRFPPPDADATGTPATGPTPDAPTSGASSAVPNSTYANDPSNPNRTAVQGGVDRALPRLSSHADPRVGSVRTNRDGTIDITVDGQTRNVRIEVAPADAMFNSSDIANYDLTTDPTTIRVAEGVDPHHVERALAHEIAEISSIMRHSSPDPATAGRSDGLDHDDAGRIAEVRVLLVDADPRRASELDALLEHMNVLGDDPATVARREAIEAELGHPLPTTPEQRRAFEDARDIYNAIANDPYQGPAAARAAWAARLSEQGIDVAGRRDRSRDDLSAQNADPDTVRGVVDPSPALPPSSVLPDQPAAPRPYSADDRNTAVQLRDAMARIDEIDRRLAERDQQGDQARSEQIGDGDSNARQDEVARVRELLGELQLGGTDPDYINRRLAELEELFPDLTLRDGVNQRVDNRRRAEDAHARADEARARTAQRQQDLIRQVQDADPVAVDRLVIGAGMAGLTDVATLPGGRDFPGLLMIGTPDPISQRNPAALWGQRPGAYDPHPLFGEGAPGATRNTVEDPGEFMHIGELNDAMDIARDELGVAPYPGTAGTIETPATAEPGTWPDNGYNYRVPVTGPDGTTRYVYANNIDVTSGPGGTRMPNEGILSQGDLDLLRDRGDVIGGNDLLNERRRPDASDEREGRVFVYSFGPTGAWAARHGSAELGADRVDWGGSSGTPEANQERMDATQGINRTQDAFNDPNVSRTTDPVVRMRPGDPRGVVVTFDGPDGTYDVHYNRVAVAMGFDANGPSGPPGADQPSSGQLLDNLTMDLDPDGTPTLQTGDGAVRVLGAAATSGPGLRREQRDELRDRQNAEIERLTADSPSADTAEFGGRTIGDANRALALRDLSDTARQQLSALSWPEFRRLQGMSSTELDQIGRLPPAELRDFIDSLDPTRRNDGDDGDAASGSRPGPTGPTPTGPSSAAASRDGGDADRDPNSGPSRDPSTSDTEPDLGGTASNMGDFRGDAREGPDLTHEQMAATVGRRLPVIRPHGASYDPATNTFRLADGRRVRIEVGTPRDNSVASFEPDGRDFVVTVSSRARDQDVARAVAHELAEINARDLDGVALDNSDDRPDQLTTHLLGRYAEIRVLLGEMHQARLVAQSGRVRQNQDDLRQLIEGLGLDEPGAAGRDRVERLRRHDPALFTALLHALPPDMLPGASTRPDAPDHRPDRLDRRVSRLPADQQAYYHAILARSPDPADPETRKAAYKAATNSRPLTEADIEAVNAARERLASMRLTPIDDGTNPNLVQRLISFDGTWNSRDDMLFDTNPALLAEIFDGPSDYQIGVGTSPMTRIIGGATGFGITNRINRAYDNLVAEVNALRSANPDTQVVLVLSGFSRGSTAARAFANVLNQRGIPDLTSADGSGNYSRYHETPRIGAMILFDTVGSVGIPGNNINPGLDLSIPANAENVLHLTSGDEHRRMFPLSSAVDPSRSDDERIAEIELPGAHSDVGGSYPNPYSQVALQLVQEYLARLGARVDPVAPDDLVDPADPALRLHHSGGSRDNDRTVYPSPNPETLPQNRRNRRADD
jgi:hypothetical protein